MGSAVSGRYSEAERAAVAERRARVKALRVSGKSISEVAALEGRTVKQVSRDYYARPECNQRSARKIRAKVNSLRATEQLVAMRRVFKGKSVRTEAEKALEVMLREDRVRFMGLLAKLEGDYRKEVAELERRSRMEKADRELAERRALQEARELARKEALKESREEAVQEKKAKVAEVLVEEDVRQEMAMEALESSLERMGRETSCG